MQDVHLATSEFASASPLEGTSSSASVATASCASSVTPQTMPGTASATAKGSIWQDFDIQVLSAQQHQTTSINSVIETRRYGEEKVITRNSDPLVWWRDHEQTFPSLSRLDKKYLGITAGFF